MKTCTTCHTSRPNDDYRRGKNLPPFDECRECRVKAHKSNAKPRKRPEHSKDHLVTVEVPCMRCGSMVPVEVEPGCHIKHKFCSSCIKIASNGEPIEYADMRDRMNKHPVFDLHCTTYLPGDSGFQQRAAEVMAHHAINN